MSEWGPFCRACGHPSSYHGVKFCKADVGSTKKQPCDCTHYTLPAACECGWSGHGSNHYHDGRMGRKEPS